MGVDLTAGEVAWLRGLTRREAEEEDLPRSALAQTDGGGGDHHGIPTWARWAEVRAAETRVAARAADAAEAELRAFAAQLRGRGYTESEVADLVGSSQQSVHRRFRAGLVELLEELGVSDEDESPATSRVSACLRCGIRPRARRAAVVRKVKGKGPVQVAPERQLGVCAQCVADPRGLIGRAPEHGTGGPGE